MVVMGGLKGMRKSRTDLHDDKKEERKNCELGWMVIIRWREKRQKRGDFKLD